MCLPKYEIVCGKDLGAFFLLTVSEQPVFISITTFAVRTIGNEPFNGSEMGTGRCEMTCFLIKTLMTIKYATRFFYYNT